MKASHKITAVTEYFCVLYRKYIVFIFIVSIAVMPSAVSRVWLRKVLKHMLNWLLSQGHSTWNSLSEEVTVWTVAPAISTESMAKVALFSTNLGGFPVPLMLESPGPPCADPLYAG